VNLMKFSLLLPIFVTYILSSLGPAYAGSDFGAEDDNYVVMLSLDGFRHDYLDKYDAPNLERLVATGINSKGLVPGFPSSTFPNHYSIVTGLYPGNHGLIGNSFYHRERGQKYAMKNAKAVTDGSWYGGLPLWQAVQQAGMPTASFFWVGSEAKIQGAYPSFYERYSGRVPNAQRVAQTLEWLRLPLAQRPRLVTLYFSTVDSAGHNHGPDSAQVRSAVRAVDKQVGVLMDGLAKLDLPVNLIITSDHGMDAVLTEKVVFLDDHINLAQWRGQSLLIPGGPLAYFYSPDKALVSSTYAKLRGVANVRIFKSGSLPKSFHFNANDPRTPDLILVADPGGYIGWRRAKDQNRVLKGAHGYRPKSNTNMRGILMAAGPSIKSGLVIPTVENVHIYPFVLHLLGVPITTKIDGQLSVLAPYLKTQ
jgi:predicted AlkP superfamily pyrophosphatase or phosphodiesterase